MADDVGNEDQWLYGDSNSEQPENENKAEGKDESTEQITETVENTKLVEEEEVVLPVPEPAMISAPTEQEEENLNEDDQSQQQPSEEKSVKADEGNANEDDDEDDDSDDDVQVVIGDIKTSPTYTSLNIKRGGLLTSAVGGEKLKQPGKFSIEEFEAIGSINGCAAHEFNLDTLEDKPWRKPGADITDYFNYGFNEETWRAYCERQKRIRIHESGVGLAQIGGTAAGRGTIPVAITNDNSKYSGFMGPKKAGPPPGRKMGGTIDVIGGGGLASRRNLDKGTPPKENVIQVMTADRREYSRKPPFPDMSVPPPPAGIPPAFDLPPPPHGVIPSSFPSHIDSSYGSDFYPSEADPYYHAYEPTQDSQWNDPTWQPTAMTVPPGDIKVITPAPLITPLPPVIPPPSAAGEDGNLDSQDGFSSRGSARAHSEEMSISGISAVPSISIKEEPGLRDEQTGTSEKETRERTKDRSERSEKSERHRDRSHRHRSRSRSTERRSRRHKSRSRSPGHRSHRKKKSRRSEREKSKEESE